LAYETLGEFDRARADLESSLQLAQASGDHQLEWRALIDLGKLSASRDYNQTRGYFEQALDLARRMGAPTELAVSLNRMGNWIANDEQPLKAVAYHQEALKIFEQLGNTRDIANTLDLLGIAHLLAGDYNASVKYYDRAIPIFRELDDRPRLVSSLIGRGVIDSLVILLAMLPPDPAPNARQDFREALQIARDIGSSPDEAWASWALGLLYTLQGNFGPALEAVQEGARIASEIGHREWLVGNLFALGVLYCELLAPEKALLELQRALALAVELRSQYWINHVTGAQATAYLILGNLKSAQSSLDTVITRLTPMDTKGKRYCWARRAELALAKDDPATALAMTDRLITSAVGMSTDRVITFLWHLKGEALAMLDRMGEAEASLHTALANAQKTEERFLQWRIHASLGQLYQMTDRAEIAEGEMSAGRSLVEEMATTLPDEELAHNFRQRAFEAL
jgi:tetratricopeptide (TPR) repeat protein